MFFLPAFNRFSMAPDSKAIKNQIDAKKVKNINCLQGVQKGSVSPGRGSGKYKSKMRNNLRETVKRREPIFRCEESRTQFSKSKSF